MKTEVHHSIENLITAEKYWFNSFSLSPENVIKDIVSSSIIGVYCLWWNDKDDIFPKSTNIFLPAGSRGEIQVTVKPHQSEVTDLLALYIGKGYVRTRLRSHLKPSSNKIRNPYQWLEKIFPKKSINSLISKNMGFSFIKETNKLEQIYAENLGIGILKPICNLRLTA
jgi:hypothetical protein